MIGSSIHTATARSSPGCKSGRFIGEIPRSSFSFGIKGTRKKSVNSLNPTAYAFPSPMFCMCRQKSGSRSGALGAKPRTDSADESTYPVMTNIAWGRVNHFHQIEKMTLPAETTAATTEINTATQFGSESVTGNPPLCAKTMTTNLRHPQPGVV